MKTYEVLYAEDVPHYGVREIEAADDRLAIQKACDITPESMSRYTNDPDHDNPCCRGIVHIEGPDGVIAENISLDDFHLCRAEAGLRLKIDAAEAMFEALQAQEMAEFDPEAARRKGYFDRARALRQAALSKARGQQ